MAVVDRVVGALVTTAGLILVAALAGIVVFTAVRGMEALQHLNFYTETTAFIGPDAPLDEGGIFAAMIGTLEQVAISHGASACRSASPPRSTSARCAAGWPAWCGPWSRR